MTRRYNAVTLIYTLLFVVLFQGCIHKENFPKLKVEISFSSYYRNGFLKGEIKTVSCESTAVFLYPLLYSLFYWNLIVDNCSNMLHLADETKQHFHSLDNQGYWIETIYYVCNEYMNLNTVRWQLKYFLNASPYTDCWCEFSCAD